MKKLWRTAEAVIKPDQHRSETKINMRPSAWIMLGFVLWIGFFIGAIILHAMNK